MALVLLVLSNLQAHWQHLGPKSALRSCVFVSVHCNSKLGLSLPKSCAVCLTTAVCWGHHPTRSRLTWLHQHWW